MHACTYYIHQIYGSSIYPLFSFVSVTILHPHLISQVHAAYKRALLKFHPDRASRTDIYHQVEAEEKFKLISRMKEKFMLLHDRMNI